MIIFNILFIFKLCMLIRKAIDSDREIVLDFCKNTFEWGDYIDRVWDSWINDSSGLLLVTETNAKNNTKGYPIALSRISACPNNLAWIEGLRVNPSYRKQGVATSLVEYMLNFGIKKGFKDASAIVSVRNTASQKMLEKQGFFKLQRFNYYNISLEKFRYLENTYIKLQQEEFHIKVADYDDILNLIEYLKESLVFNQTCKRYFDSWKFYIFQNNYYDLKSLIENNKILLIINGSNKIKGLLLLNNNYYVKPSIQVCYFDCIDIELYSKIIKYLIYFYLKKKVYSSIQFYLSDIVDLTQNSEFYFFDDYEKFFIYNKILI